jgi:peptide/nickel transport system permease protein
LLARRPNGGVGLVLIFAMLGLTAAGLVHTPYDPIGVDFAHRLQGPSGAHWLGTDEWGRDVLSRLLAGAVVSIGVSGATALVATAAGAVLGAASGFLGGWFDRVVIALMDALLAFPALIIALALVAVFSLGAFSPILALAVAYFPSVVRVVRASVLTLKQSDYVAASKVMGNGALFTLARHVLPNAITPVVVLATSLFGWALLAQSALSFLGLGVPPPAPSWGGMLADSRDYFAEAPWLAVVPGLAISASLLGVNLLGDALRDLLDPRMRNLR